MKADISDAPERIIRRRHTPSMFYTVVCLVLGSVATVATLQLINRSPSVLADKRSGEEGAFISTGKMPLRQELDPSQLQLSSNVHLPADTARQTVFNDQNFMPRGADNVVKFVVSADPLPKKEPAKKVKVTVVEQPVSLKDRACESHKQGSIEARNCRAWVGLKYRN